MTTTTIEPAATEAKIVAGRTASKPRQSRAGKSAALNAATASPNRNLKAAVQKSRRQRESIAVNLDAEPERELTSREKNVIALSALNVAASALIQAWNDPRLTQAEARAYISHRLSYSPPSTTWPEALDPRTELASRTPKS
jgi:hypothetical protein